MIITGDCLEILPTLDAESVQCVVTSPPYYGLRDYGCEGQIGLEPTPEAYVEKLVAVFRGVRRVLRDDGTVWLNLGDSYAGSGKGGNPEAGKQATNKGSQTIGVLYETGRTAREAAVTNVTRKSREIGLKPKDLLGIPWRIAFALQADGWWLRQDIIWAKPNPMPESVTDRCTKAHEYIFLLTKSARYYMDMEAVKEPVTQSSIDRLSQPNLENQAGSYRVPGKTNGPMKAAGSPRGARDSFKRENSKRAEVFPGQSMGTHRPDREESAWDLTTRNRRSVWTITTKPFKDAHFATFPPEIPEICIKAGTSEKGCCPECGSPWERVVEKTGEIKRRSGGNDSATKESTFRNDINNDMQGVYATTGWRPACRCGHYVSCDTDDVIHRDPIPCTVLDPFSGAGTTGLVAEKLGRKYIGIDIKPAYNEMAEKRIGAVRLPLLDAL